MPAANLAWTNLTGDGQFGTAANWRHIGGSVSDYPPTAGDSLTFSAEYSNANCNDLYGDRSYASIRLVDGYLGRVTFATTVFTEVFTLESGSIAQPGSFADLTVTGTFTWRGGTLNSTPSDATVNITGGGEITLAGEDTTLTAGSTLVFASQSGAAVTTVISGAGELLLNGTSPDAMFVRADAKVVKVVQVGSPSGVVRDDPNKKLTLEPGGEYGYVGAGTAELGLEVINRGGKFFLGDITEPFPGASGRSRVTLQLTAGEAGDVAYTQTPGAGPTTSTLQLMNGCVLDLGPRKLNIHSGQVLLIGNTDLAAGEQVATIKGTFRFYGGAISFVTPTRIGDENVWGKFKVDGDADWEGGDYRPGLNGGPGDARANQWVVTGILRIRPNVAEPRTITPTVQELPAGQPLPDRNWDVIVAEGADAKITGHGFLTVPAGWQLVPDPMIGDVKKLFLKK